MTDQFLEPTELTDSQLDVVAGGGGRCGCNGSLINVDVDIKDVDVDIL